MNPVQRSYYTELRVFIARWADSEDPSISAACYVLQFALASHAAGTSHLMLEAMRGFGAGLQEKIDKEMAEREARPAGTR